jgi:hypothetical protein
LNPRNVADFRLENPGDGIVIEPGPASRLADARRGNAHQERGISSREQLADDASALESTRSGCEFLTHRPRWMLTQDHRRPFSAVATASPQTA